MNFISLQIQFLGGAGTVTGSKHLVSSGRHRYLVDCGLFQGVKSLRLRNRAEFPVDPREIDCVLLTHAHLDHSGYLPLLVRSGFRGRIYCSAPTRDLCRIILLDSARLQEEDARFANREAYSKHHPALPLYTREDAERALERLETIEPDHWVDLPGSARFRFQPSSHILGSVFVELEAGGKRIVFTGDLGRSAPVLYAPPRRLEEADYLVIESTYGDRLHPAEDVEQLMARLREIVARTIGRGGHLIIPSFAVGRAQELLLLFARLAARCQLPAAKIYLDTPMGTHATEALLDHSAWHTLDRSEIDGIREIAQIVRTQQESIAAMRSGEPSIVIAGSGMAEGGRVLHHLAAKLPDPRNTVLLVGFQAAGTRGRLLRDGSAELKMHGRYVPVRAEVVELSGLSAHADQAELIQWARGFVRAPSRVFVVHGEPQASDALRIKMRDTLGWETVAPAELDTFRL